VSTRAPYVKGWLEFSLRALHFHIKNCVESKFLKNQFHSNRATELADVEQKIFDENFGAPRSTSRTQRCCTAAEKRWKWCTYIWAYTRTYKLIPRELILLFRNSCQNLARHFSTQWNAFFWTHFNAFDCAARSSKRFKWKITFLC
jgi:hypothetical protein